MDFKKANDIQTRINKLVASLKLTHIDPKRIICFRGLGSSSLATARIWSLPQIWQKALNIPSYYIVEVIAERFDTLKEEDKTKVLIHELLHIPKTFSGALRPHRTGTFKLSQKMINKLYREHTRNQEKQ